MKSLISTFFILSLFSCDKIDNNRTKIYDITTFDKTIYDTLIPVKGEYYGAKSIEVKGYTNDTIIVSFGGNYKKQYLSKEIDTVFSIDYYGEYKAVFIFDPYKSKKGKLKIKFKI